MGILFCRLFCWNFNRLFTMGGAIMPCHKDCQQGRLCDCSRSVDRTTVVVATLLLICIVAMVFGVYKIIHGNTGSPCAVNVKFNGSTATYIGQSI